MMRSCLRVLCRVLLAGVLFSGSAAAGSSLGGFGDGETFVYRVSWGIFRNAGLAVITAETEERTGLVRVVLDMEARGAVSRFYPMDTRSLALLQNDSGRILWRREVGYDGRNGVDSLTEFDHAEHRAVFVDRLRPERNRVVEIPAGETPTDLIFALIQTRRWDLQPGEERDALVYASRDVYPLTIRAEGYEEMQTPMGSFRTHLLVPRMRGEPKGIFERGGQIKVWISEGNEPLPVRMQLSLNNRIFTLTLLSHDPGQQLGGKRQTGRETEGEGSR